MRMFEIIGIGVITGTKDSLGVYSEKVYSEECIKREVNRLNDGCDQKYLHFIYREV